MALIPGFDYDIFISYSHVDNAVLDGQTDGWIEQFYKNLNLMLAKRFGRMDMVKIWWDNRKINGNTVFNDSIKKGINESAILLCFTSNGYLKSEYCMQELDTFYKKAQSEKTGLKVADRSRIINVLMNNIPFKEWPTELSGTSGFPFHDAKEAEDFGDPIETASTEFKNQMQNLRDAVWHLLTDFPKEQIAVVTQPDVKPVENKEAFTIYIGEVADTLRTPRKRVITELEKKGFKVVTGIPPPDEAAAHEQSTKEALQNSHLAIHLLDELPGREIVGTPEIGYPQKQTELSLQSGKSQMIWMPAETDFNNIEDEKYKLFLQGLETGKASEKSYEFIRGSKSTLAQEIIDFADQLKAQQLQKKSEKGKLSVLLDTHYNDQLYALDLSKTLLENQIQPFINPQEDDPRKNINLLGERISQVKKLIFLYGSVSKEWVLERMSAALQLIITNNYPIEDFFIYMAPPHKEANDISIKQKFLKVNVIDSSNNQNMDKIALEKFLNDLRIESV
ncbi:MAG: toll/interleukin-1 receptor domain-containing protein [Bacteroidota bacterium]